MRPCLSTLLKFAIECKRYARKIPWTSNGDIKLNEFIHISLPPYKTHSLVKHLAVAKIFKRSVEIIFRNRFSPLPYKLCGSPEYRGGNVFSGSNFARRKRSASAESKVERLKRRFGSRRCRVRWLIVTRDNATLSGHTGSDLTNAILQALRYTKIEFSALSSWNIFTVNHGGPLNRPNANNAVFAFDFSSRTAVGLLHFRTSSSNDAASSPTAFTVQ